MSKKRTAAEGHREPRFDPFTCKGWLSLPFAEREKLLAAMSRQVPATEAEYWKRRALAAELRAWKAEQALRERGAT